MRTAQTLGTVSRTPPLGGQVSKYAGLLAVAVMIGTGAASAAFFVVLAIGQIARLLE